MTFDNQVTGSFSDVRNLYDAEKENLLKTSPLTDAAVRPSKLQLQNVQHVLKVFNDKVEAALRLQKCGDTADIIHFVLNWWNVVNVSSKHQEARLNDPHRHVQDLTSTNLSVLSDYHQIFQRAHSGHGKGREHCVTHDTKKALVQTMQGMASICAHLLTQAGFQYVLLRELQSDRIEGEFSVYRQSTGANAFMTSEDVLTACKKRQARYAASYLETLEVTAGTWPIPVLPLPLMLRTPPSLRTALSLHSPSTRKAVHLRWQGGWRRSARNTWPSVKRMNWYQQKSVPLSSKFHEAP